MTDYRLRFNAEIGEFEKKHMWKDAAEYAYEKWKRAPMDLNALLCAGTQAMYCLLEADYDNTDPHHKFPFASLEPLKDMLIEATQWGINHFSENAVFNAYFGYMIRSMPVYFLGCGGNFDSWQVRGSAMLQQAIALEPDNPFVAAIGNESNDSSEDSPFKKACAKLWSVETPETWGKSGVNRWLFYVLDGDHYFSQ